MKTIPHSYIDTKIIEELNKIGYNKFYEETQAGDFEFYVNYDYENKYNFCTQVIVSGTSIEKDKEFHCINSQVNFSEFKAIRRSFLTLQGRFDKWLDGYNNWLNESYCESKAIEETEEWLGTNF